MKSNVIIILMDGSRVDRVTKSEFFNKLKNKSAFFSHSITYGPHTIVAMHAVFSGSYGNRTGTNSYWSTYKFKKRQFKTITEYLYDINYYTYADVVNELVIPKQGFDKFTIHNEKTDDLTARHSDLLNQMSSICNSGKNFFLFLQYSNIHTGIMEQVLKVYNNFSKEYFDNKELNEKRYDSLFQTAEIYLKTILNKITELGFYENSLILIISDHGISIGEKIGERAYGAFCYDYTLRTFAYFLGPKIPSIEIKQQVRTVDFMPTILDYLDVQADKNFEPFDGESLLPLIYGQKINEKMAYSESGNPLDKKEPPKEPNVKSLRTSKWKLIFNEYNNTRELYDLENDPKEETNLAGMNLEIENYLWNELLNISKRKQNY